MAIKNKKTLKKKIRGVINYCVIFTIILFSCFILAIAAFFLRVQTEFMCKYYTESISQTMNSSYFLKQMNITDIKALDPNSQYCKEWFANIDKLANQGLDANFHNSSLQNSDSISTDEELSVLSMNNLINLSITLEDKLIYSKNSVTGPFFGSTNNDQEELEVNKEDSFLLNYFETTTQKPLFDSANNQIGMVTASVNNDFIVNVFISILGIIIIFSLLILIFNKIIIRIITTPIVNPLKRLNETINSLTEGDFDNIMNSRINVKRPLREIEDLASSTNKMIDKMKDFNEILTAQNEELEAQNEELTYSKSQIQDQQAMLVQIENMASVGQLTAAITHEINTPLGAINSNSQMFEMFIKMLKDNPQISVNEELVQLVDSMNEINGVSIMACNRVSEIIRSLKIYTRIDQAEFQETNIIDSIKSVLILSSNLWKKKITIHEDYGELHIIKCYSGLLNQVFMNVLVNSIQAIEGKGDIYIKTYNDEEKMYISFRDTGTGISDEDIKYIFDMGFTTKGTGIGMGLGLAISYNIVEKHNGEISVNSELGVGTEFIISIPLTWNEKT